MAENKKSNQADAYMESMKAYQKTYDFLLYLCSMNGNAWEQRRKKGQNKKPFHYMIYL